MALPQCPRCGLSNEVVPDRGRQPDRPGPSPEIPPWFGYVLLPAATLVLSVFVGLYVGLPFGVVAFGTWTWVRSDSNRGNGRVRPPGNEFLCNRCVHRFITPERI
ncbi:hypothetical protein [Embleya hyalina]|uniref:Uncharacterized protein n=1 Tax=Embleya hyalina TaxID=516124 RepID=A0A401Z6W6_9ACTN|nr:hypothetical protein [Embleya hyalina]GCE02594.1 hypothetical protein EHYA_10371 [Embleya hyalina]